MLRSSQSGMVGTQESRFLRGPPFPYGDSAGGRGIVERTKHQRGYPRVRPLIQNPSASTPLMERQAEAFWGTL